jgi:hypothetical protein
VILYANRHPLDGVKGKDLETVLKEIGGKVVGYTSDSIINNTGTPNLRSIFNITDPDVDQKIKTGDLCQSLGFRYSAPAFGYLDNVIGDHVLLYDRSLNVPQGDQGSMILNQDDPNATYLGYVAGEIGDHMADNNNIGELATVLKNNMDEFNSKFLTQEKEKLKIASELEAEKGKVIKLNQDIEGLNKTVSDLKAQITKTAEAAATDKQNRIKANQDSFWNGLPDSVKEKFEARKGELSDPELIFKLNQDIQAAIEAIPKPGFRGAQGFKETNYKQKNNQGGDGGNADGNEEDPVIERF